MYEGLGYRQNSQQKPPHHKRLQRPQHPSEGHSTTKPNRRPTLYEDFAKAMVLQSPIEGQRSMIEDCVKVVVLRREGKNLWGR
jgi:hypothetical protein